MALPRDRDRGRSRSTGWARLCAAVLAAVAVVASGYLGNQPGDARLVADQSPAPGGTGHAEPAAFALPCAASWGQAGVLAAVFHTPAAPAGVNVCGAGSLRPAPAPASCTKVVAANALQPAVDAANPGDRICAQGVSDQRLTISRSGTPTAPIQVVGVGQTAVKGITIKANDVVVAGFNSAFAVAPGIQLTGNDITLLNNTVSSPRGGDGDGIRFFGDNISILHNTVRDVRNLGGAHADCMQTFATNTPTSQRVLIASNRCEQIDNQCLIAEGPHSSAGDGSGQGQSSDITFTNNYCDTNASQALMIDDVQNVVVTFNSVTGGNQKAFAFANKSTGAKVSSNVVAKGIGYLVGMDSSSQQGYQGPPVGGKP